MGMHVNTTALVSSYFTCDKCAKYCDKYVCLFVRSHNLKTTRPNVIKFLCMLPTDLARSSSNSVAIRYVLPVLRMTSHFHITALWCFMCIPEWQQNTTSTTAEISTKFFPRKPAASSLLIASFAPVAKSAVYNCTVLV